MFRFFSRMNIATQLTILVIVVIWLAVFAVTSGFKSRSKQLVLARSSVTLADECQLRGYALRDAVRSYTRDQFLVAKQIDDLPRDAGAVRLQGALSPLFLAKGIDREALAEVRLVEVKGGEVHPLVTLRGRGEAVPGPQQAKLNPAVASLAPKLRSAVAAAGRQRVESVYLSPLVADPDGPPRFLLAVASFLPSDQARLARAADGPQPPPRLLVLTVDFTRLVHDQARHLPRHLLFVTDDKNKFVYHPDPADVGKPNTLWQPPAGDTPGADAGDLEGPLGTGRELPGLSYWFTWKTLGKTDQKKELADKIEEVLAADARVRYSKLGEQATSLVLSSHDEAALVAACKAVTAQERLQGKKGPPADWERPILCKTFVGYRLPREPLDPDEKLSVGITLASAEEELTAEANTAINYLWLYWVLPILVGLAATAFVLLYLLMRPLRRLTEASQRLAQGDYGVEVETVAPGEVGELARAFQDMTARIRTRDRELSEKHARLNTILVNAADGIITFDQAGQIEHANAAAEEMFGVGPNGLAGTKVQKLMKLPDHLQKPVPFASFASSFGSGQIHGGTVTQMFNAVKTPGEVHRGVRRDGSSFWMEVTFSQVPLEDRRVITGIFRDVTQRKLAEERINLMNDELDARVRLRTAQLEDAKTKLEVALAQAEAANLAKDRFISVVSHELRTPLTSAMGYTELLLNPRATRLRENPGPTLEKILTSCKHLLTLINDLLDVGRYTAGKPIDLAPQRFDLSTFLRGVQEMVTPLVKKNGNAMEAILPPGLGEIYNDETRLRQVLLNLLSNASKFTEGGKVCLQVERRRDAAEDVVVYHVSDTGGGMTAEQVEKLFTPFYRVDNSMTRKVGGTGLGLTITKMICELMGGSIVVQSTPGQGSTFTVTIPAEIKQGGRKSPGGDQNRDGTGAQPVKGTILVIDDDATIRHMLETYLQQEGFRVVLAATGAEGLRLAREHQPMSITLDVLMPGEDGWDVLGRLKNDPATRDIPVIMLTIMEERNRGFALGATEYVTKPIDWGRLGSILCRYQAPTGRDGQPILIVEDDALQRGYLREELILAGWTVLEAANGAEGLKVCESTTPSLILLDLTMPIMDGFTFLDELRRRDGGADIPVVVLTARELSDEDRRRLNRSVAQVLAKESLEKDRLLDRIRGQMEAAGRKPA